MILLLGFSMFVISVLIPSSKYLLLWVIYFAIQIYSTILSQLEVTFPRKKEFLTFSNVKLLQSQTWKLNVVLYSAVPENIYTHPTEEIGISWGGGGGGLCDQKNLKKCMKLNWIFQRGGKVLEKIPSTGEVWIFSRTTHCFLLFFKFEVFFMLATIYEVFF